MVELKKTLGTNIKKIRLTIGITQEELAAKVGISVDFLSLIECGKNAPSFKNLEKIAKALEVSVSQLFIEER